MNISGIEKIRGAKLQSRKVRGAYFTVPLCRFATLSFLLLILFLSGCGLIQSGSPRQIVPGGDVDRGRELLNSYGCDACHTIPRLPGAVATVGPSLENWAQRAYIAGVLPNNPDNLMLWIQTPQEIEPGTAMPNLGVTEQEARDIAAFMFDAR